jgi:Spy/CpxP family protein refolding chaperone
MEEKSMLKRMFVPVLAAAVLLGACSDSPTSATAVADTDDYALMMFGEVGSSLEGTMGPAPTGGRPFDGSSYRRPFPEGLQLTDEQREAIAALRAAFRAEHAEQLDALKAIFEEARAARAAGATREEIRAILVTARPIAMALRIDLVDLHYAIWSVFTDEQKAWILSHRPHHLPPPMVPQP